MESSRYLRCLGQPALFAANGEPIRFRTKKHLALLVFLAVESRRAHRRDRLAEFLWPDAPLPEARHSLATALSILRPRLGVEALDTTRDHVALLVGRVVLDLDRLIAGDVLGEETNGPLEVAAFLDGFEIPGAREFGLWKDRQQARLLPAIKDALVVLIDRCRRMGATRQIEQLADRMLALDELSEEAVRAKMEARALAGDRLTALKIFEEWKEKLAEELGAVPSDLVEGMAVRLRRRGWERTTLIEIPTVPTDQWRGRPFVGRTAEYRVLYEAWEEIRKGLSAHPLVLGDSGIGKTTLVERLTTAAGLEGAAISRVQCYDLEREIPYATVGTLIQGLLDRPGVSATPPDSLAELARTVPEVRRRFPSIPAPADSQGETARIRLTESFHDMLTAISEEHPVILVVDDLHLADDASLAVLHLIMRRGKGQPIMVIMIARPGELHRSPQASRLRDSGRGIRIRELDLCPLTDEESRDLLRALVPPDAAQPNASAKRALLSAAGGFPMVLELLYQDWEANGDQSLALAVDAMTAELGGASAPPQIYREVLDRLLRALEPATHGVLNVASILGHRLNDLSVGQTMTGMAELVSRRVLRDGGKGLEFVNELVRTAAYLGVPSPLRRVLHSSIADHLIKIEERGIEALGLEIAWHCMRAGRPSEATPHLMRGARDAIRSGAPQNAERALSSALSSLSGDTLAEASILLAEVLHEQGRVLESLALLSSLTPAARELRVERVTALTALAKLSLGPVASAEHEEHLLQLARIVQSCSDAPTRALAGRALAYLGEGTGNHQRTRELLGLLETIPSEELDADSLGQLSLARALLLYQSGDSTASFLQAIGGIDELTRRGAANLVMVQLQGGLGSLKSREGRYVEALAHYEQALGLANRLGNDRQAANIMGNIALCCGRLGRYSEQLEWACKAPLTNGPDFAGFVEIQVAYSQAFAHAMRERIDLALKAVSDLESRLVGPIPAWMLQAWSLWKADLLLLCKQRSEAMATAQTALREQSFVLHSPAFAGPYARWLSILEESGNERGTHSGILSEMAARLSEFDALDQVDILCALRNRQPVGMRGAIQEELRAKLDTLPTAIKSQLISLGMLPFERLA
jgi:DNA-binding SARP family transcriptional activator/tetratricopeptide (TPR) repeat protein